VTVRLYLGGELVAYREDENKTLQVLKQDLRNHQLKSLYMFHGEETFLLQHYLGQMKKQLVDELTESFNYHKLTKETFDMQVFADAVESLPMMAEKTFVWVDDIDIFKLSDTDRNRLAEQLADIPDYCTLVFTFETTPWKPDKRLKKLWDAISGFAEIVEFPKQSQRDLVAWIGRHFAAEGKKIAPELCVYLIDITGGTMTALAGEISKIAAYSDADVVVKSDIDAVTEPVLDAVVFQMTDMLGEGKYGPALEKLQQLLKLQQKPIAILGAVGNHFRRIAAAVTLYTGGKNASDLARLCGMSDYAAKKTMSAAKRFSPSFCAFAAAQVMETDAKMKTSYDEPERLLEFLILRLAEEARNGQHS